MSDLSVNVKWREILRETESGDIPHCRAISAPLKFHDEIIETLGKMILGENNFRLSHPDLLIIGESEKAPNIEICRNFISDIALKPSESKFRLGIVRCADKLLLPAANSLLKLAEEPPSHARLIFIMEDGGLFLPTLKSRSRFSVIVCEKISESREMPKNDFEWVEWLNKSQKYESDEFAEDLESWSDFEKDRKNFMLSDLLDRLRIISAKKNLSAPMLRDILIITLKENNNFEYILNDLR